MGSPDDWTCYRHPDRKGGVRCSRCERPLCPECMITAPVGFQCPSCVKGGPQVRTLRSLVTQPRLTQAIIAVNVVVAVLALAESARQGRTTSLFGGSNALAGDFALNGGAVAAGEWWRLVTSGFLHYGLLHLGFNMFILLQLGTLLEPALGRVRLGALYVTALLGGALGVLLLEPNALTAGASGAVFGLMGALLVVAHKVGGDVRTLLMWLGINALITIVGSSFISWQGHLGGFLGGVAIAGLVVYAPKARRTPVQVVGLVILTALLALAIVLRSATLA